MTRAAKLIVCGLLLAAALLTVRSALAQDPSAAPVDDGWPSWKYQRGPGYYLSTFKILLSWGLFALWVRTTNWVGQDCLRLRLNYVLWNLIVFVPFVLSFVLLWILPSFAVGFPLMLLAYFAPFSAYVVMRNQTVPAHQRLLTPAHMRHKLSGMAGKVGVQVSSEKVLDHQKGAPVDFKGSAGGGRNAEANLALSRQTPGYVPAKGLFADLLDRGGDNVLLEFTAQNVGVRYQIDGVWHNVDPLERNAAEMIGAALKMLGGLDPAERSKRQEAAFAAEYQGTKYNCKLLSQGAQAGERVALVLYPIRKKALTLEELGMRSRTRAQLDTLLNQAQGMIFFSSLPAGGLSSLFDAALSACDCYTRDFAAVEDVKNPEFEVENVHVTMYDPAAGEKMLPVLEKMVRSYPNVLVVRNIPDGETGKFLCDQVQEERLVLTAIRSKDAAEALLRVLLLKVPAKDFARAVSGVVAVRMVRKLCEECKEAYAPLPEVLQQFGIPAGKIQTLFQPPSQPDPKRPCPACDGIGYKGRIGMFELLTVDDGVREVLVKNPKIEAVRAAARKAGLKTFQEEGLVLVVKGVTSLAELQRVLKL